jgi:tether containing UBX domain for GLUT4
MPNANVSREILKTRKIQETKESAHKSRIRKVLAGLFM